MHKHILTNFSNMKCITLFLVYLAGACSQSVNDSTNFWLEDVKVDPRIINGVPAEVGQFPWQAAIAVSYNRTSSLCGGSLISDSWILTAAHCLYEGATYTVILGGITRPPAAETGRIEIETTKATAHEKYKSDRYYDVGLIKVESVIFNERIKPIRLPSRGDRVGKGTKLRVSGWGLTDGSSNSVSPILNWVDVTSISNLLCAFYFTSPSIIFSSTLCTMGNPDHSPCNGDSGGPLMKYDSGDATQVGIVSFGKRGCPSGLPAAFVRTEYMLDWIAAQTGLKV